MLLTTLQQLINRLLLICMVSCLTGCNNYSPTHKNFTKLEQIQHEGTLNVLIQQSPTTYYEGAEGLLGLEYNLIMLFAEKINVKVNFIVADTLDEILQKIASHQADIAATGITITEQRKQKMRFSTSYQSITEQVIYRSDNKKPHKINDLENGILEVAKSTSHIGSLLKLKAKFPSLSWNINNELSTDGLMYLVNEGLIDYTIANSQQVSAIRRFYPKLNIAFDITKPRELAWAMPLSEDNSLYEQVNLFFQQIKQDKTLLHLLEKYYGNLGNLSYVGNCKFRQHIESRLPKYLPYFKKESNKHGIDWRLLAAIGYQESHWKANAISPTGVKGLMMLTKGTAKQLGIKNRANPQHSIRGGALYFKQRLKKIPERISEPDKTWFALASYNVGFGHLEDARIITQKQGKDPDKWMDVKQYLPLLSEKEWYQQTKHGYARGQEPVTYVENIRSYYDLLVWLTEENQIEKSVMSLKSKKIQSATTLNFIPSTL